MGGKIIVTHNNPDLDAVTSIWLIVRWLPGWEDAEFKFVPAGKTYQGGRVDSQADVLHVDTGLGKLDHHQTDEYTCAAKLTLEHVKVLSAAPFASYRHAASTFLGSRPAAPKAQKTVPMPPSASGGASKDDSRKEKFKWNAEALERLVEVVNQVDHFQEVYYAEPSADYLLLGVEYIFDGWKLLYREQDSLIVEKGLEVLDGIYISFISKIEAEKVLEREGTEFETKWGKGVAAETKNDMFDDVTQKKGYKITVRRHPKLGHIRIKAMPEKKVKSQKSKVKSINRIDLTPVYNMLMRVDEERRGDWFLHESKTMLLNGSAKNPKMRPTKLSLSEVIKIIQNV
jgi:hypothetical protein